MEQVDFQIRGPINLRIEEALVQFLKASLPLGGIDVVAASDREVTVPPLHVFVYCNEVTPQLPTGLIYKANVAVVLVTNIDDHTTEERRLWWSRILQRMSEGPNTFDHDGLHIAGWSVQAVGETSDGQQTGDTARLMVAVQA